MYHPVAYGVCKSGVSDDVMPGINGELACDDGGAYPVPVLQDLEDVPAFPVLEGVCHELSLPVRGFPFKMYFGQMWAKENR